MAPPDGVTDFEGTVAIGTYDGGLLGLDAEAGDQTFGFEGHTGCVKAMHGSGDGFLASGGTDNLVKLFDVAGNVDAGELVQHGDAVNCVEFWGGCTLVTGDGDGQVCIWSRRKWDLLLKFRAHKAPLTCIAIHPTGRLMASAGRDKTLRLWDLTRGTAAANLSTDDSMETLAWSGDGSFMGALGPKEVLLVNLSSNAAASYRDPAASGLMFVSLTAMVFLRGTDLLVGDGKGELRVLQPGGGGTETSLVEVCRLPTEKPEKGVNSRIKAMARCAATGFIVVGSSSGRIETWRLAEDAAVTDEGAFSKLWAVETGARLTCLSLCPSSGFLEQAAPAAATKVAEAPATAGKRKKRRKASESA